MTARAPQDEGLGMVRRRSGVAVAPVGLWNATGGAAVVLGMSEGPKRPPTLLDDAKTDLGMDADHGITIPRPMGDLRLLVAEFSRSLGVQS